MFIDVWQRSRCRVGWCGSAGAGLRRQRPQDRPLNPFEAVHRPLLSRDLPVRAGFHATLIRANVSWDSMVERHASAVLDGNASAPAAEPGRREIGKPVKTAYFVFDN